MQTEKYINALNTHWQEHNSVYMYSITEVLLPQSRHKGIKLAHIRYDENIEYITINTAAVHSVTNMGFEFYTYFQPVSNPLIHTNHF